MVDVMPLLSADLALLVYAGIRLGWWAPQSAAALNESMGRCGRIESWALIGAIVALPIWAWLAR